MASRRSKVVALVGWKPGTENLYRPKGASLGECFEAVARLVWSQSGYGESTRQNTARTRELSRALGDHPSPADVLGWYEGLRSTFKDWTAYLHMKNLGALYAHANALGIVMGNPVRGLALRRPRPTPKVIPNLTELWPALLDAAGGSRERLFLGLGRFALLRRREALGLVADDIDQVVRPWTLEVARQRAPGASVTRLPKSEAGLRVLPVAPPLRPLLEEVLALGPAEVGAGFGGHRLVTSPFLCPFTDDSLGQLAKRVRKAAPEAFGDDGHVWHALRDTGASELHKAGVPLGSIRDLLGHTSEHVTRTHYLGIIGRRVNVGDALSRTWPGAPPGEGTAPPLGPAAGRKSGARSVAPDRAPRPTRQVNPNEEEVPCRPPKKSSKEVKRASRKQRALPGLAVGPVVRRKRTR